MDETTATSDEGNRPRFKRRTLLILPDFQLKLIYWNLAITLGIFALIFVQTSRAFRSLATMGAAAGFAPDNPFFTFVNQTSSFFYSYLTAGFILGAALSAVVTLFVSHRMAGPVYRLMKHFETIRDTGKSKAIRFRKGDFLFSFADTVNQVLRKITD